MENHGNKKSFPRFIFANYVELTLVWNLNPVLRKIFLLQINGLTLFSHKAAF